MIVQVEWDCLGLQLVDWEQTDLVLAEAIAEQQAAAELDQSRNWPNRLHHHQPNRFDSFVAVIMVVKDHCQSQASFELGQVLVLELPLLLASTHPL